MRLPTSALRHGIVAVLAVSAAGLMLWPSASLAQAKLQIRPVAEKKLFVVDATRPFSSPAKFE
jgi:hypothetical protein